MPSCAIIGRRGITLGETTVKAVLERGNFWGGTGLAMSQGMNDTLEQFIDQEGLQAALRVLSEICYAKAEHVETNWQDHELARAWTKAATALDAQSAREVFALP